MDLSELDPNMAVKEADAGLHWYDARGLTLEGRGWTDTPSYYSRLPRTAEGVVRDAVWQLAQCPAGMAVRFTTDAADLAVRWDGNHAMSHMPALGVSGLDLYVKHEGRWKWLSVARPEKEHNQSQLFSGLPAEEREFMLYLPLYNPLQQVQLGIPETARIAPAAARTEKPLCFYGTSITQGGCASRPGMCYTAILGRRFDMPVINLGFSGNGWMDLEIADLLCELDPAAYILNALPNMDVPSVKARTGTAVRKLKCARPGTPVVLVDHILFCDAYLKGARMKHYADVNRAQYAVYEGLIANGITELYYLKDNGLIGTDGEATVDGIHLSDLGYVRFSGAMEKFIRDKRILSR